MKIANIYMAFALGLSLTALTGCGEDLEKSDYDRPQVQVGLPAVTTGDVEVFGTAATATFAMTVPEGVTVQEQGFVLGTDPELPLASESTTLVRVSNVTPGEQAQANLTGLIADTTYYVKAYAYVEGGIAYGETKSFDTNRSDEYERQTDFAVDFTDATMADAARFTAVRLGATVNAFQPVSLAILGADMWGFAASVLDPVLYETGRVSIASPDENNLLTYKADFTGKNFPAVSIEAQNVASFFGDSYAQLAGDFDVLISEAPITNEEELAAATVLGTCKFATDPTVPTFGSNTVSFDIPAAFSGVCYITIHSHSTYDSSTGTGNFGIVVTGFRTTSLHQKAQ